MSAPSNWSQNGGGIISESQPPKRQKSPIATSQVRFTHGLMAWMLKGPSSPPVRYVGACWCDISALKPLVRDGGYGITSRGPMRLLGNNVGPPYVCFVHSVKKESDKKKEQCWAPLAYGLSSSKAIISISVEECPGGAAGTPPP